MEIKQEYYAGALEEMKPDARTEPAGIAAPRAQRQTAWARAGTRHGMLTAVRITEQSARMKEALRRTAGAQECATSTNAFLVKAD